MLYEVFLSHNSQDKAVVERIARKLKSVGVEPWLDKWCLTQGGRWQDDLLEGLQACSACAVFVGPAGIGDWAREEIGVALDRAAKDRSFRVFPVLLPGVPDPFDFTALPGFLKTRHGIDLRAGIDDSRAFQGLINAIKGVPLGAGRMETIENGVGDLCPYRGLQAFDEEHAEFFFGRASDVQRLVEKLKGTRFLTVLGSSGTGKSSLVRAGLVPALKKGALTGSDGWTVRVFTPGAHPLETVAAHLLRVHPQEAMQKTLDQLSADRRTLHLAVSLALTDQPTGRSVWVVDQFEEVFTLCRDEQERSQFLANVLYAATIPDGRVMVVLTLRADFYPRCAAYPELSQLVAAQQYLVSPLDREGLRQVIEEPAWKVGLECEAGLVGTMLDDVASQPGALPLLEHALLELWERRRGGMLTLEGYRESGGVQGAIAKRANGIYERAGATDQAIVRRLMLRLTQPGEGSEDTRRRAALGELVTRADERDEVEAVVRTLVDARLLTIGRDEASGEQLVDVAHEALIRGWPALRQWIDEDRAGLRIHRRLTEAAQEWERLRRDAGPLYRGARLAEAVEWREHHDQALNEQEREFLGASVALQERDRRSRRRRQRLVVGGLLTAVAWLTLGSIGVLRDSDETKSRELTVVAGSKLQTDPELSVLLSIEALRRVHTTRLVGFSPSAASVSRAEDSLRTALSLHHPSVVFRGHTLKVNVARFSPDGTRVVTASDDGTARLWDPTSGNQVALLSGHTAAILDVSFSPDGRLLTTASDDKTGRVWDVSSGRLVAELSGHDGAVYSARFSPDGKRVVTSSWDKTVRIWEASTGKLVGNLVGHTGPVAGGAAFSPDGRWVVSASADKTARVWEADTGRTLAELRGHRDEVSRAVFSPDGTRVVTVGKDGTARVWEARTGRQVAAGPKAPEPVSGVAFSPDGKRVVTASLDGLAFVWDAETGASVQRMWHKGSVRDVDVSQDGEWIVTASDDRAVRVWAASGAFPLAILGNLAPISTATFSPDGKRVVSVSSDGTVRVWHWNEHQALRGHTASVNKATFSSDGRLVATASDDKTARVWETRSGKTLSILRHAGKVTWVAFSPNDRLVVSASEDKTARVWEASTGKLLVDMTGHRGEVSMAAFSPDGKMIATASADNTARLWEASSGRLLGELRGHTEAVSRATFSHDSLLIVTASLDGTARIWRTMTGELVADLRGHKRFVTDASFGADGTRVITSSADSTARIWDVITGRSLVELKGHRRGIFTSAFSPDGKRALTASADRTARIWDVSTGKLIAECRQEVGIVYSAEFSHDGKWVVTAGLDGLAGVWDSMNGKNLDVVTGRGGALTSATFSPDDKWLLTSSRDGTVLIDECLVCGSPRDLLARARERVARELTPEERATYLR